MIVVIRSGGSGTRLWPLSRERRPKQFQRLLGKRSLLERKLEEVRPLLSSWRDLYVSTNEQFVPLIRRLVPRLPINHIIAEPERRNTGPAVALETAMIKAHHPASDPIIASLSVDDVMPQAALFRKLLQASARYLEQRDPFSVVTIGCPVTAPDPGFSYLVLGRTVERRREYALRAVKRWIEKPSRPRLTRLLRSSNVVAHTGLYVWRASTVLDLFEQFHPHLFVRLQRIQRAVSTRRLRRTVQREFKHFPVESVESLIVRRATRTVAAVADLGWKDTGKWFLIQELRRQWPGANVIDGTVVTLDTKDSLVWLPAGKVGVTIGLKGMVIVDTGDALLVCPKDRSEEVKRAVERLRQLGWNRVL